MSTVQDALYVAERGFKVFPARNKKPLVAWKDAATTEPGVISVWWRQYPNAEVGVPMPEGTVALDIDDMDAVRATSAAEGLAWPETLWQLTRSGGYHAFYNTDGRDVPQVVGRGGIKLDTRAGNKGYVIAYDRRQFDREAWGQAPEWVYEHPYSPQAPMDPAEPMGTHAAIISWLGRVHNATDGLLTEEGYMAVLRSALNEGRIVSLDPTDPWTDAHFRPMARDATKFEVSAPLTVLDSPWQPEPEQAPMTEEGTPEGFLRIIDYRATVPLEVPWVVPGIAYRGGVTLLSGPAKAGKSTLMSHVQKCREGKGGLFLGQHIPMGPTLLVTEEGGVAVLHKTDGLNDLIVYDRKAAAGETFEHTLNKVAAWLSIVKEGLVFIDTLAIWAGIDDENDASKTTKAIARIMLLAQTMDAPIVIVHHTRKGGGNNGEAIRGSGAILATVDISLELSRVNPADDDRYLDIQGRVVYPDRYRLEFDRSSGLYAKKDMSAEYANMEEELSVVPSDGEGYTRKQVNDAGMPDDRLNTWVGRGRIREVKRGQGRASLFWRIPPAGATPTDWRMGDEDDE